MTIRGDGCNPTVRNNRIHKNKYEAVWVYEHGGGTVEENDLSDNGRGAFDVSKDSDSNLIRNNNKI